LRNADFDSFIHSIQEYFKVDATKSETVVGYMLTPAAGLKYHSSYSVLHNKSLYTEELNCSIHLLAFKKALKYCTTGFEGLVRNAKEDGNKVGKCFGTLIRSFHWIWSEK